MINVVVGAGILGLPAKTFALIGPFSISAWLLCALIMGVVALFVGGSLVWLARGARRARREARG